MNRTLEPIIQIFAICMAIALLTCAMAGKAWGGGVVQGPGSDIGDGAVYLEPPDCYWEVLPVGMFIEVTIARLDGVGKSDEADQRAVGMLRKIPVGWEPFAVNSWMPERQDWQKGQVWPNHTIWLKRRVCP